MILLSGNRQASPAPAPVLLALALGLTPALPAEEPVAAPLRAQFAACAAAVGVPAPVELTLQRAPTWVRAASQDWVYTVDLICNRTWQSTRPAEFVPTTLQHPAGGEPTKPPVPPETKEKLITRAWQLAEDLAEVNRANVEAAWAKQEAAKAQKEAEAEEREEPTPAEPNSAPTKPTPAPAKPTPAPAKPTPAPAKPNPDPAKPNPAPPKPDPVTAKPRVAILKHEILLLCRRDARDVQCFGGRYLVRLNIAGDRFFQVTYSAEGDVLRIDSNVRNPRTKRVADALAREVPDAAFAPLPPEPGELQVGMFFNADEYKYPIRACMHEGEAFLDLSQHQCPFGRDNYRLDTLRLDMEEFRKSQDYRRGCWDYWTRYGRVGGPRGNHDPNTDKWDFPNVELKLHKSMTGYPLVGGEPRKTVRVQRFGKEVTLPHAAGGKLAPPFYADLERVNVAWIFSHGGNIGDQYRFCRSGDVWVVVEPPPQHGLGSGQLRHLFCETCGAMTCVELPKERVLLTTWVHNNWIDGVRTISGIDGGHAGTRYSGWRFYGYYHRGDAVSAAWAMSQLDENPFNCPVTVGYGATQSAALETLYADRFTTKRAGSAWAAVSIWTNAD